VLARTNGWMTRKRPSTEGKFLCIEPWTMSRPCEVCGALNFGPVGNKHGYRFERCSKCELERIEPAPTDEVLARIYGEHYYDAWGLKDGHDAVAEIKKGTFQRVVQGAGSLPRGAKVLDLGAATGFLLEVAKERGYEPFGVELSEFGAKEMGRKFGEKRVFRGQFDDATFDEAKPGEFDAVFMCDYIEHVREPAETLRQAFKWLKPGGVIGLTTPRLDSASRKAMGMGWTHYKIEHLYYFGSKSMGELLTRSGFVDYRCSALPKTMTLAYIAHQFKVYPHPLLSHVAALGDRLPSRVRSQPFPILMGDLVAYARKPF
jgi:2-polyprenyl-3-methyl-5-hydroxy-6-metoxy-1,4-benzoquinol methylase